MNNNFNILQWNPNGFFNNFEELKLLIQQYSPYILCIQETHLKVNTSATLKNYQMYRNDIISEPNERARGGVCICVDENYFSEELDIQTDLQAIAVKVLVPLRFTVCSIYLPPSERITEAELENLFRQLPTPFLVLGDFNSHSSLWDNNNPTNDRKSQIIENLLDKLDLICLNNGLPTHFSSYKGTQSAIDLSIGSPIIQNYFQWNVQDYLSGSDHYPIILSSFESHTNFRRRPKWSIKQANWEKFSLLVNIDVGTHNNINDETRAITENIVTAAKQSIPRTTAKSSKIPVPWWSNELAVSKKKVKKLSRISQRVVTPYLLLQLQQAKAQHRRAIKKAKKDCWEKYVSTITVNTNISNVWQKIRRIRGNSTAKQITTMETGNHLLTEPTSIANCLASWFSSISSSTNYCNEFLEIKNSLENEELVPNNEVPNALNDDLTIVELEAALKSCSGSSAGPDDIHYAMLKHLPIDQKICLIRFFNNIWKTQTFPSTWREAITIPILKPGKNKNLPSSYRPISLTSCLCKLMEKIVNRRLSWFLESNNIISNFQFGFRKGKSTNDALAIFENDIHEAINDKQHLIAIFFDFQNAFDIVWKRQILATLIEMGINGNMFKFIENFLHQRIFRVAIGDQLSEWKSQENGTPQGSILSTTLFIIAIDSVQQQLAPAKHIMYADDLTVYINGKDMAEINNTLQRVTNKIDAWCNKTGFKLSTEKTTMMHFCRMRKKHPDPVLKIKNQPIKLVEHQKFLGVIFQKKLTWKMHIKHIKSMASKNLGLIKTLASTKWGTDRNMLLTLHQSLVLSRLNYGSSLYHSASKTDTKTLDAIHNLGIRLATGSYRTSPVKSLLSESGLLPLDHQRQKNIVSLGMKMLGNPSHPLCGKLSASSSRMLTMRKSFVQNFRQIRNETTNLQILPLFPYPFPYWLRQTKIDMRLTEYSKQTANNLVLLNNYHRIIHDYDGFIKIFTDGSKTPTSVGSSYSVYNHNREIESSNFHLPPHWSIFSAELHAILKSLEFINESSLSQHRFLLLSDSKSALESIQALSSSHSLTQNIHKMIFSLQDTKEISFMWIPSHIGINGIERADHLAKSSCHKEIETSFTPSQDYLHLIKKQIIAKWENEWAILSPNENKLREVKPTTKKWITLNNMSRKDSVIITRLRIGHTEVTHGYILNKTQQPVCQLCNLPLTVKHILNECCNSNRTIIIGTDTLANTLKDDAHQCRKVIKYLRTIGLYDQI